MNRLAVQQGAVLWSNVDPFVYHINLCFHSLGENVIGPDGAKRIAEALKLNKTLLNLE